MTGTENENGWKGFRNQRKDDQKGMDNFVLVVGLYNHDSRVPVANFLPLICHLDVLKMWEPRLWYHPITSGSHGYVDVTATYICRVEIPSHIYAKHQYRQESEYESKVVIYISTIIVQLQSYHRMWSNIIWILHHQEVQKYDLQEIYNYEQYKRCSRAAKRISRAGKRGLKEKGFGWSADDSRFHYATLISNWDNPQAPTFKIWTCRSRVVRRNPTSTKWGHEACIDRHTYTWSSDVF